MKLRGFLYSLFVAAVIVAMSSCSKMPKSVSMLHENPAVVIRMDVKQLADKGELSKEKGNLESKLKEMGLSKEALEKIKEVLDDPVNLGLDLRDPVFASLDKRGSARVVGTIYDDDDFKDFLVALSKDGGYEVDEKDGLSVVELGGGVLAFNGDCFLITSDRDDLKKMFEGGSDLSDDDAFREMCDSEGDIQLLVYGEELSDAYPKEFADRMKNVSFLYDLCFNQGEIVQTCQALFKDDAARERFEDYTAVAGDIKGDYAQYFSKDGLAIFGNIDGEKLYNVLDKLGILKQFAGEFGISESDMTSIVKSLKGDCAFGINELGQFNTGSGALFLSMDSDKLLQTINTLSEGELRSVGSNQYVLDGGSMTVSLGYDKGAFYAIGKIDSLMSFGSKGAISPFVTAKNALSADDVKGKGTGFYAFLNFKMFDFNPNVKEILKYFDYAESYYEKDNKVIIRVVLKDKEKNALPTMISLFKELPSIFMSMNRYDGYGGGYGYDDDYPEFTPMDDDAFGYDPEEAAKDEELEELMEM